MQDDDHDDEEGATTHVEPETHELASQDEKNREEDVWVIEDMYEKTQWVKQADAEESDYEGEENNMRQNVKFDVDAWEGGYLDKEERRSISDAEMKAKKWLDKNKSRTAGEYANKFKEFKKKVWKLEDVCKKREEVGD